MPSERSDIPMPRDLNNVRSSLAERDWPAATRLASDFTEDHLAMSAAKN